MFLISSWTELWFVSVVPKYLNSSTLSKELFSFFILSIRHAFWFRDMTMYLVLSAFKFISISLLATTQGSLFFYIVYTLPPNILTSPGYTKRWWVPFNFKASWFTWTLLMTYSKEKLKSNGDKTSPSFKPFLIYLLFKWAL